jgi:hypothetical protein
MRNKSGNSWEPTGEIAPLVRRPRNIKEKGELAELAFLHKAASLGFGVAKPYGDSESYDFILDSGKRFLRVQVKSIHTRTQWVYRTQAHHNSGQRYTAEDIDFLVAYVVTPDIWYVIPVNCVTAASALSFYPSGCQKNGGQFECYREAWHLMAPGAGLPRPGTVRRIRAIAVDRKYFAE